MTFLTPIPALVAAAVTVPLLLVLYFLKLRRRPVRVSSTLLWSDAVRDLQVNVPFRMLRPSWLLVLQLLILACFLIALARPAVRMEGGAASRVILLVDRSASMAAADAGEGRTRLDDAKRRAIELIDTLARSGAGTRAAVIAFGAEPVALTNFTTDWAALRAAVREIEPTDLPGDLPAALQLAGAMFRSAAEETGDESSSPEPGLAVLFSDGSFDGRGPLTLAGATFRFVRAGPAPEAPRDNLGIVALSARRDFDDPAVARIFVRLLNAAPEPVAAAVSLSLDGSVVQRMPVVVPAAETEGENAPGLYAATFDLHHAGAGVVTVTIDRPDPLAADNEASLVLQPASRPRVVVVVPNPPPGEQVGGGQEWLLTDILREMDLRALRVAPASAYEPAAAAEVADLLIFDRVRPNSLPAVPSIHIGAGLPVRGVAVAEADDAEDGAAKSTYFLSWLRSHPILRDVALDQVFIARPRPIRVGDDTSPAAAEEAPLDAVELARGRQGPLIVLLEQRGVRRLVLGFELAQSNWPAQFSFPIFLAEAVDYLTLRGSDLAGVAFTTTEPAEVRLPGSGPFVLSGPVEVTVTPRDGRAGERINVGVLPRAGVYRVGGGTDAVAVNVLNEHESTLGVAASLRVGGESVQGAGGEAGPREVWPWFVLAAFVLLTIEWFLHALFMRV